LAEDLKTTKSFWERPEGTTGMLTIGGVLVGLFFLKDALLAFVTTMVAVVGQTIVLVALCGLLAAILFLVTNKKVQTLVSYIFKSVMRKLTGWFVEIDPIGIMRSYIEDMKQKRGIMSDSKDKLSGQIRLLKSKIDANAKGYDSAMATARVAVEKGMQGQFTVQSRQAGRLEKLNKENYIPMLSQLQLHAKALDKYYELTGVVIEDLQNEVQAQSDQRAMMLASYSAMSAAKKILQGGTDQKELFDQAMEYVVNDFGMKMGEIDAFMESSKGFVEGLDLQNGVYEADALAKLQAWEKKADSILLPAGAKQQLLEQSTVVNTIPGVQIGVQSVDFANLIARK
jgi:hypothetical protein